MIASFANKGTENIWNGIDSKAARNTCPKDLWSNAREKLDDLNQVRHYSHLKTRPSNRLHPLRKDRKDQWAIAINDQFRICFRWDGTNALHVEITDYH